MAARTIGLIYNPVLETWYNRYGAPLDAVVPEIAAGELVKWDIQIAAGTPDMSGGVLQNPDTAFSGTSATGSAIVDNNYNWYDAAILRDALTAGAAVSSVLVGGLGSTPRPLGAVRIGSETVCYSGVVPDGDGWRLTTADQSFATAEYTPAADCASGAAVRVVEQPLIVSSDNDDSGRDAGRFAGYLDANNPVYLDAVEGQSEIAGACRFEFTIYESGRPALRVSLPFVCRGAMAEGNSAEYLPPNNWSAADSRYVRFASLDSGGSGYLRVMEIASGAAANVVSGGITSGGAIYAMADGLASGAEARAVSGAAAAVASGGYITSSGAAAIASGAAANAVSGGIASGGNIYAMADGLASGAETRAVSSAAAIVSGAIAELSIPSDVSELTDSQNRVAAQALVAVSSAGFIQSGGVLPIVSGGGYITSSGAETLVSGALASASGAVRIFAAEITSGGTVTISSGAVAVSSLATGDQITSGGRLWRKARESEMVYTTSTVVTSSGGTVDSNAIIVSGAGTALVDGTYNIVDSTAVEASRVWKHATGDLWISWDSIGVAGWYLGSSYNAMPGVPDAYYIQSNGTGAYIDPVAAGWDHTGGYGADGSGGVAPVPAFAYGSSGGEVTTSTVITSSAATDRLGVFNELIEYGGRVVDSSATSATVTMSGGVTQVFAAPGVSSLAVTDAVNTEAAAATLIVSSATAGAALSFPAAWVWAGEPDFTGAGGYIVVVQGGIAVAATLEE